jgi:hypothetical protein
VEHHLEVFERNRGRELAAAELVLLLEHQGLGARADDGLEVDDVLRPLFVRVFACQFVLDGAVVEELAALKVDADHLAGADAALAHDLAFVEDDHAGLGADEQQTVIGEREAERSEAVAVEARDDPTAVGGGERGRAIPRFHDRVRVLVHRAVRRGGRVLL